MTGPLPRHERLTRGADFQVLFQHGTRIDRRLFIILWRAHDTERRVGFTVSRQVRGAVQRNRARRRLRAAYRSSRERAPARVDLVIIGRSGAVTAGFNDLLAELREALGGIPGLRQTA